MPRPRKVHDAAAIEQRLRDEAARRIPVAKRWWPSTAEAAAALGEDRSNFWRKVKQQGYMGWRGPEDGGPPIEINPVDILDRLDAKRAVHPKRIVTRRKAAH